MSLLDPIAIRDAVLQTVVSSDVYIAVRTDNPGNSTPLGSGTARDPYGGPADSGDWFDYTMTNKVSNNQTVRLGPGIFLTKGADGAGNQGWAGKDGLRIVGAGVANTTLKLASPPISQKRWAIGMPTGSTGLVGFQAEDFTVDCNFLPAQPSNSGNGAIRVFGSHIYLRRIKAIHFGSIDPNATLVVFSVADANSEDCVISGCHADTVHGSNQGKVILFGALNTSGTPHRAFVIRDCWGQGVAAATPPPAVSDSHLGILPGVGIGTIIENNALANVGAAISGTNCATTDLIVRGNYFRNVHYGINWDQQSGGIVGRIIAVSNAIDLAIGLSAPYGMRFTGDSSSTHFTTLIARRNVIRQIDLVTPEGAKGISVAQCTNALIQDNVISNTVNSNLSGDALPFTNTQFPTYFSNYDTFEALLRGWNTATGRFQPEWDFEVQARILAH